MKNRVLITFVLFLVFLGSGISYSQSKNGFYEPVKKQIEGWTVSLDPRLLNDKHKASAEKAIAALTNHLQRITYILKGDRLKQLQQIPIWLELDNEPLSKLNNLNMQYHPGREWLIKNGLDPRLVKHVHLPSAKELLNKHMWLKHPYVVLHELAHGFHDQALEGGFDNPKILETYNRAKQKGIYEEVLLYTGKTVRHYALSNQMEYFAEASEAYFGVNDFYPFVRAELKEFDPYAYDLMEEIWGPLK